MERGGLKSVVVYDGASCLGQLDTIPVKDKNFQFPNNEIRIHHLSPRSERCPPISVLQTISPFSVRCKLQSSSPIEQTQLLSLHSSCFHEAKTAVVLLGEEEIHLVAMGSKQKNYPCFWCYSVPCGLYNACLGMLNLRCLSIVFDLDETLIVANTMKSFEDRIEALRSWIARETDPVRILGMSAEMQRYAEDRAFLKQYIDNDCVVDHGKVYKVQGEEVPKVVEGQDRIVRPVVRLLEKNIVLTRINPEIRDTSVLVRLRPAWEDLRSYLIAKGRKRFEVYVCTMAERDYALEMWRLLDPETHLIASEKLLDRVVCVNSGAKKSLHNVFKDGNCHPKMAMVIDDRVKVWEDKDQPRVHLVPAFSPYYAPQAETANAVPVLCVARNVACNVRGGFFREFDENLLPRISELFYEDELVNLPFAPDASNYLMPEDEKANVNSAICPITNIPELGSGISQQSVATTPNGLGPASLRPLEQPSLLGAPLRRDMMNNNQDLHYRGSREPPLLSRMPGQLPVSSIQPQEGRLAEEINRGRFNNQRSGTVHGSDMLGAERHRARQSSLIQSKLEEKSQEAYHGRELRKQNLPPTTQPSDISIHSSSKSREVQTEGGKVNSLSPSLYIGVLQEIGQRCNSKVEFRSVASTSENLQFSVEVLFTGERIGFGMGKTRKDAQQQGAENALRSLADEYISYVGRRSGTVDTKLDELSIGNDKGFLWDSVDGESDQRVNAELVKEGTSEVRHGTPSIVRSIQ